MTRTKIETMISEKLVGFSNCERARKIMTERLINGKTFEQIAEMFDLSVTQCKNIVKFCSQKLDA